MLRQFPPLLCCLIPALLAGCGKPAAKDPLAGVGGYKLVYHRKENRPIDSDALASAIRTRINAKRSGDVVVRTTDQGCEILLPGASEKIVADVKRFVSLGNLLKFRIVASQSVDQRLISAASGNETPEGSWVSYSADKVVLPPDAAVRTTDNGKREVLVLEGSQPVDAWHLADARVSQDANGRTGLGGTLTDEGAARLGKLTSENRQRQLAIILDDVVISSPTIQSEVTRFVTISGDFDEDQLQFMVASLHNCRVTGSLEPEPISEIHVPADHPETSQSE